MNSNKRKLKCTLEIFDKKKIRTCKNQKFFYNDKYYSLCQFHYKKIIKEFKYYIVLIQRVYIGYRTRRKLQYFKLLPIEIKTKIQWYINRDSHIKKENNQILKIIKNKILIFNKSFEYKLLKRYFMINFHYFSKIQRQMIINSNPLDIAYNIIFKNEYNSIKNKLGDNLDKLIIIFNKILYFLIKYQKIINPNKSKFIDGYMLIFITFYSKLFNNDFINNFSKFYKYKVKL